MKFGDLPANVTGEQVLTALNLDSGEHLLFACMAKNDEFALAVVEGVIAFTDSFIYWLDGKSLTLYKKRKETDFLGVEFSAFVTQLSFADEHWPLRDLSRSDKKAIKELCANAYQRLRSDSRTKSRKGKAEENQRIAAEEEKRAQDEYGQIVVTANFGMFKKVSLHSNGYVSGLGSKPEKLIAISGEANVAKKTGLGRVVGAVASGGDNLFLSNLRGDVYVTIVTDVKTHSIHIDMKNQTSARNPVEEMHKLVATGEALLKKN